ncbi:MAG: LysR family transcriptional regulator [Motiliproteus sp.]
MGKQKTPLARQLADIDLKLLRIFKAVVEAGGFSAAESNLNIANSTISNYIADLEKRLDMRLCSRGRAGFALTEHGKLVFEASQELEDALQMFRNRINSSHHRLLGDFHIGLAEHTLYLPGNGIVEALKQFNIQAPEVRLHLSTMTAEDISPAVADGRIQLGITVQDKPDPILISTPLFDEEMVLYCGLGHPLFGQPDDDATLGQINQSAVVETSLMRSGQHSEPAIKDWHMQASALQQEARAALILTGRFIGYLPTHLVEASGWQQQLHPLIPDRFNYRNTYYAISQTKGGLDRVLQTFLELLQSGSAKS